MQNAGPQSQLWTQIYVRQIKLYFYLLYACGISISDDSDDDSEMKKLSELHNSTNDSNPEAGKVSKKTEDSLPYTFNG